MNFLKYIQIAESWVITGIFYTFLAIGIFFLIRHLTKISMFITEVKGELRKASWPWNADPKVKGFKKYKELIDSTVVVLIGVILLAGFVQFCDFIQILTVGFLTDIFR